MIRRTWHTITDPPASDAALLLCLLILPVWTMLAVLGLMPFWDGPRLTTPVDVAWAYALLHVVRQRDQARAQLGKPATTTGGA
ncbi:hypothetical protein [Streptosporangium saharense]|uniref:hypothetical protein n=1 Tax=Streptosporangium saharense TaxID=1706840 RepID=UPI00331922E8